MYGRNWDKALAASDEASTTWLGRPWDNLLCSALSGLVVLDDQKTAYVFNYGAPPDPFMHGNPYIQGEAHYKAVVSHSLPSRHLEVSSPIPPNIWSGIRVLVEGHACNTVSPWNQKPLPSEQRIVWDAKPEPFGLDWHSYLADGLAMYRRAQEVREENLKTLPTEDRYTKKDLGVFRFEAFFEAFPFDEIDPENKYPEYTAMLNDFAFYEMAPEDADEAVGFDERRKPVEPGVLAILAHVIQRDPHRASAFLNLGDALWRNGRDADAAPYYRQYVTLVRQRSTKAHIPPRVFERMKTR
jgi:hypothetical protein